MKKICQDANFQILDVIFFTFVGSAYYKICPTQCLMIEIKPKKLKRRIFNSWITSLISISLVLLMIGILALIIINGKQLSEYVKEKIGFTLVLQDNIKEVEINRVQKLLSTTNYVKSTRYIDKEEAAQELTSDLGENFTEFLGYNPLFESIEVKLLAKYTHPDSLLTIEKEFLKYPQIKEIYYHKSLVTVINQNVKRISFMLLLISSLLTFIFVVLINNTIRISVYSQRFTINTMQMVGASNSFIIKPFLQKSLLMGIYGSVISNIIIILGLYSYRKELFGLISFNDLNEILFVFLIILSVGIILSILTTFFAVNKFLKLKFDQLFY